LPQKEKNYFLRSYLNQFFAQKSQNFYEKEIMKFVDKWRKIEQNSVCLTD